jgi:hypothetical protein
VRPKALPWRPRAKPGAQNPLGGQILLEPLVLTWVHIRCAKTFEEAVENAVQLEDDSWWMLKTVETGGSDPQVLSISEKTRRLNLRMVPGASVPPTIRRLETAAKPLGSAKPELAAAGTGGGTQPPRTLAGRQGRDRREPAATLADRQDCGRRAPTTATANCGTLLANGHLTMAPPTTCM